MSLTTSAFIRDRRFDDALQSIANSYCSLQRKLFKDLYAVPGRKADLNAVKRKYISEHGLTSRGYNAMLTELKGKMSSLEELKEYQISKKDKKLKALERKIKRLENAPKGEREDAKTKRLFVLEQLVRKCARMTKTLDELKKRKTPRICFGSNKLFRKQFNLKENGYKSHAEWKKDWDFARNSQFMVLGSGDEALGNQSCQYDGEKLTLRLPNHLVSLGESGQKEKYLEIPIEFDYLWEDLALATQGASVSYRFIRRERGWYVHASFTKIYKEELTCSSKWNGALGVDLNYDHVAVTHVNYDGNLIKSWTTPILLYKRKSDQIEASIGDAVAKIQSYAKEHGLPVIIENLNFENKKNKINSKRMNRILNTFITDKFSSMMKSRCDKHGITVITVNPAFTSIIGKFKFAKGYGLSVHQSAAMVIARRGLNLGESLRMKARGAAALPVRNRAKHVWSDWSALNRVAKSESSGRLLPSNPHAESVLAAPLGNQAPSIETPKGA